MSRINRIYCEQELTPKDTFILAEDTHHYLSRVLRLKLQDEIYFFNHLKKEFRCSLVSADRKSSKFMCHEEITPIPEPIIPLQLNIAICKSEYMTPIIQKATELGVSIIQPLITQNNRHHRIRINHLQGVARSASEQCHRVMIPTIYNPIMLSDVLPVDVKQQAVVLDPFADDAQPLSAIIQSSKPTIIAIGSEGGWQDDEVIALNERGFCSVYLGQRILRSDTAVITAISLIQYQLGQLQ